MMFWCKCWHSFILMFGNKCVHVYACEHLYKPEITETAAWSWSLIPAWEVGEVCWVGLYTSPLPLTGSGNIIKQLSGLYSCHLLLSLGIQISFPKNFLIEVGHGCCSNGCSSLLPPPVPFFESIALKVMIIF